MAIFKKKNKRQFAFVTNDGWQELISCGYKPLSQSPEVAPGVRRFAELISSMTIYLMANTEKGDKRIKNELSRKVDIEPTKNMTRRTWMDAIIMNLLLYGNGNSVVIPETENGYLGDLIPVPAESVTFIQQGTDYIVQINGINYPSSEVLHFVHNPDPQNMWKGRGLQAVLKDVVATLNQSRETEKAFLSSKWKPSLIVKVDGLVDEFSSKQGRQKLLKEYLETAEAGEPWMIPSEAFSVEQVRPLTLGDLAINDSVTLDKKTVASILGIPPFVLGVGDYNKDAWDAFVNNSIKPIVKEIEQELTRKLLISPKMYWKFNVASLYSYDLKVTADVYSNLYTHGIVTGNEVRDKIGLEPIEDLDELIVLENYIPLNKIGDQNKLGGE